MKYKDTYIPASLMEEVICVLNSTYLILVNERLFGECSINCKEFEKRVINLQNDLLKKSADY